MTQWLDSVAPLIGRNVILLDEFQASSRTSAERERQLLGELKQSLAHVKQQLADLDERTHS